MTRYIAALDLAVNQLSGRSRWRALAAKVDVDVRQYIGRPSVSNIEDFIGGASGLWLYTDAFLDDEGIAELVHRAIAGGTRCLVEINVNERGRINEFLQRYGLEGTSMGLHSVVTDQHPRLISIQRATHAEFFHHPVIFEGVDSVLIQQPQVLRCHSESRPVLAVPLSDVEIVDLRSDLLEDLDAREVAVIGAGGVEGHVIAMSGGCFHDGYVGPLGDSFPGIEANNQLATNTLRWLAGERAQASLEDAVVAFALCDRIERTVARYLRSVLARVHLDWWTDGVLLSVREKCVVRSERERNQLERHCYMDLTDWKEAASANWRHIEADWRRVGWSGNRTAGLEWFDELNAIRNMVMHPTKRAFGPDLLSPDRLAFLRELRERVAALPLVGRS